MKQECKFSPQLSLLIDGELPLSEEETLRSHLKACAHCQRELKNLQQTDGFLSRLGEIEPSAGFSRSFWEKAAQIEVKQEKESFLRLLFSGWRPYAATAAVAVIALFIMLHQRSPSFNTEEVFIAEHLELFENLEVIDQLDFLENPNVIKALDEKPS